MFCMAQYLKYWFWDIHRNNTKIIIVVVIIITSIVVVVIIIIIVVVPVVTLVIVLIIIIIFAIFVVVDFVVIIIIIFIVIIIINNLIYYNSNEFALIVCLTFSLSFLLQCLILVVHKLTLEASWMALLLNEITFTDTDITKPGRQEKRGSLLLLLFFSIFPVHKGSTWRVDWCKPIIP